MNSDSPDNLSVKQMRFGKISATLLIVAGATFLIAVLCKPGWGNPLATLGALLIMFSPPAALIFGIVGIIQDRHKLLAITATLISGGIMLLWAYMIGIWIVCYWASRPASAPPTFD